MVKLWPVSWPGLSWLEDGPGPGISKGGGLEWVTLKGRKNNWGCEHKNKVKCVGFTKPRGETKNPINHKNGVVNIW